MRDEKNIFPVGSIMAIALWILFAFWFHSPENSGTMEPTILIYLTLLFFTFTFYQILIEIKSRTLKRPKFTFRISFTLFLSFMFYLFTTAVCCVNNNLSAVSLILLLLFLYLITPILIAAIILFTNPFFNFQKKRIIKRAAEKVRGLKEIKVIGITGSYGKTSNKEFLYTILSQKYKVVKTEGNNNTNIGVARTVLNKASDEYDYFICEMGAYKIGEIEEICGIVKPEIGILTGINEQHLDLFGSIENTIKAKFELIEALPENGLAILNGDNKYIELEIGNWKLGNPPDPPLLRGNKIIPPLSKGARGISGLDKKIENIILYSLKDISDIKVIPDHTEFIYKDQKFRANLSGRHYIENLLAAIVAAENLGMNLEEISEAIKKIKPSRFMMRKLDGVNNSVFIDDSYSANPDGVIAALNYLDEAYQDYKKIIVFPGIIELGKESEKVHRELFGKIDEICDVAYIIRIKNQESRIKNKCKFIFEKDFNKVASLLKSNLEKIDYRAKALAPSEKTVVLFESRGAGVVMGKL